MEIPYQYVFDGNSKPVNIAATSVLVKSVIIYSSNILFFASILYVLKLLCILIDIIFDRQKIICLT